jgi:hypothetical protein
MLAEVVDAVIGINTHRDTHEVEIAVGGPGPLGRPGGWGASGGGGRPARRPPPPAILARPAGRLGGIPGAGAWWAVAGPT